MLFLFAALAAGLFASASAQSNANNGDGELLIPGIWIDPDGCEHWAMDDRFEGFMSPVVLPNGRPVCGRDPDGPRTCGLLLADMILPLTAPSWWDRLLRRWKTSSATAAAAHS